MRAKIDLRVADTSDDKPLKPDEQAEFCTPREDDTAALDPAQAHPADPVSRIVRTRSTA